MAKSEEESVRRAEKIKDGWRFHFRFLVRKEDDLVVAYCLELDLVATGKTEDEAVKDLINITIAQVSYCLSNDNMDRLFRRAPEEIWNEYYDCEKATPKPRKIKAPSKETPRTDLLFPFSFIANACRSQSFCHAV